MRFLPIACLALVVVGAATPAFADPPNAGTYKEIVAHGLILVAGETEIDIAFTPDGKFTAFKGLSKGVWKIDGDKLCTTAEETGKTDCAAYPADKKSGDEFMLDTINGPVKIRIR